MARRYDLKLSSTFKQTLPSRRDAPVSVVQSLLGCAISFPAASKIA
ncbi:hypothetical protein SAMN04487976_12715 [Xaviernesmea oryzae]|nr:hypothetical protein SAMN04487976_12715 [Xaviernesmea oryzae]